MSFLQSTKEHKPYNFKCTLPVKLSPATPLWKPFLASFVDNTVKCHLKMPFEMHVIVKDVSVITYLLWQLFFMRYTFFCF